MCMYYCVVIKDLMKQWKEEARVKQIILYNMKRDQNDCDNSEYVLELYTNRPGPMIGMSGCLVNKYRDLISSKIKHSVAIKLIETAEIV